jgi:ATP synthase protein I
MVDRQPSDAPGPTGPSGWAALGTLLSGVVVWGGVGFLFDRWLDIPKHYGLLVGMVVGLVTALYMVMKRFG